MNVNQTSPLFPSLQGLEAGVLYRQITINLNDRKETLSWIDEKEGYVSGRLMEVIQKP